MDTRTDVRHHVENLLTGVSFAVSGRDRRLLAELTRGVRVRLGDGFSDPEPGPEEIWAGLGEIAGRIGFTQTISTIGVYRVGNSAHYMATFQNWEVGPEPACTSIGTYSGCLVLGPQVWKWTEHAINRGRNAQTRRQDSWIPYDRGLAEAHKFDRPKPATPSRISHSHPVKLGSG